MRAGITKPTSSTLGEAAALADYLIDQPQTGTKISVITSTYHTFRARLILKDVLKKRGLRVQLIFPKNTFTSFNAARWYASPSDINK